MKIKDILIYKAKVRYQGIIYKAKLRYLNILYKTEIRYQGLGRLYNRSFIYNIT